MTGPLEGVVILDLTQQLAGPGGTMLLGDMGAVVIRVDPPPAQVVADVAPSGMVPGEKYLRRLDLNIGRSKRSISLDLSKPEAREIVYAIARRADGSVRIIVPELRKSSAWISNRSARLNPTSSIAAFRRTATTVPRSFDPDSISSRNRAEVRWCPAPTVRCLRRPRFRSAM